MKTKKSLKQKNAKVIPKQKPLKQSLPSVHPWRICPYGEHWVITHPMRVPPSKLHPAGSVAIRRGHCAKNPSGKDQLYPDEILEITQQSFKDLKSKPLFVLEFVGYFRSKSWHPHIWVEKLHGKRPL